MTTIEITTGSKSEATDLAARHGGEVRRVGLLRWKVTIRLDGDADLDEVAEAAREMGLNVTWN